MTDRPDMSGRFFLCPLHACAIAAGDAARNVSTMPRLRLAPGSLARQLGGRHDGGGGGTREGSAGALQGCMAPSRFGTACRPSVQARLRSPCTNCPHQVRDDGANAPFVLSWQPLPRLPSRETLCTMSLQCAVCIIIAAAPQGNKKRGALVCRSPSWVCPFVRG